MCHTWFDDRHTYFPLFIHNPAEPLRKNCLTSKQSTSCDLCFTSLAKPLVVRGHYYRQWLCVPHHGQHRTLFISCLLVLASLVIDYRLYWSSLEAVTRTWHAELQ